LTGFRLETQVDKPFLGIVLSDDKKPNSPATLPRDLLSLFKIGVRHEFKDSALEAGWLGGWKRNATKYIFTGIINGVAVSRPPCELRAEQSIGDCASPSKPELGAKFDEFISVTATDFRTRPQFGAFFNMRLHVPLGVGDLKFHSQETGEFFRKRDGDLSVDTRYRIMWKNALDVPVFGNLKLAPSIEWFFYENKKTDHSFGSRTISVDVKYSFDWHSGLSFKKALMYANPTEDK
jgi:hypothetical protein